MQSLTGRVALVSGTGPNIGQEVATLLAEEGAKVVCLDREEKNANDAVALVEKAGSEGVAVVGDLSTAEGIAAIWAEVAEKVGTVDALVNSAAVSIPGSVLDVTPEQWDLVTAVTFTAPFLMSQAFAKQLIAAGKRGSMVNVASTSGHKGRKNAIAYCSAKGGVLNMTRALAMDLAPHGIRVNSVSPTKTGAPIGDDGTQTRDFSEIPLGRLGRPRDQANAIRFLLSDEAEFITGLDIRVDGGTLATWGTKSYASKA